MATIISSITEWVKLLSLFFCIGALVIRLWIIPSSVVSFVQAWRFFTIGMVIIVLTSFADLLISGTRLSGQNFPGVLAFLPEVITKTHFGRVWIIRVAALALIATLLAIGRHRPDSRTSLKVLLGTVLLLSITQSASGHAADKGDFSLAEIADWLHLMAVSVWGGGLLVLSFVVLPPFNDHSSQQGADHIPGIAQRFSTMAGIAVGVVAITASVNGWFYIGEPKTLWTTPYGATSLCKAILFIALLMLGALNRYISVPLLNKMHNSLLLDQNENIASRMFTHFRPGHGKDVLREFTRNVKIEAYLVITIVFLAALLRSEVPPRHLAHLDHGSSMSQPQPDHHHP